MLIKNVRQINFDPVDVVKLSPDSSNSRSFAVNDSLIIAHVCSTTDKASKRLLMLYEDFLSLSLSPQTSRYTHQKVSFGGGEGGRCVC